MKKKAIIAIVSLIVFGQGAWAQQHPTIEGLTYNNEGYYAIPNAAALNALATYVNAGHTCAGLTFMVTNNITFTAPVSPETSNFTPIGWEKIVEEIGEDPTSEYYYFSGTFDGNGKTISGITVDQSDSFGIGVFGFISGATIKNLKLTNCSFSGNMNVGSIVGYTYSSTSTRIENCEVAADVYVNGVGTENGSIGGIVGVIDAGTVENCTCAATVTGNEAVGGIAGWVYEGCLVDCNSSAKVSGRRAVGGIAGKTEGTENESAQTVNNASITDCFYTGESSNVSGTSYYGIIVGEKGNFSTINLNLLDNDTEAAINNATRLSYYNGVEHVDVKLDGRTLYKDGGWNTICLPFNVVDGNTKDLITFTGTPLEGAIVKKLDIDGWYSEDDKCYTKVGGNYVDADNQVFSGDASTLKQTGIEGDCLYLNFATAESIEAGKPYLIKWASGTNITDPEFEGVTINANASTEVSFTGGGSFVGTYNAKRFTTADLGKYLIMGGDNTLYYTKTGAGIGACRAYFQVPASSGSNGIKMFNLNFSDYSATTKITNTNLADQTYEDGEWWTLSGMKLNGKPTEKGVYLFNGKKVVIQ